jgi:hypothetical protein
MIGRAIGIVHRNEAPEGYTDLDHDDYKEGDPLKDWQEVVLDTALRIVVCLTLDKPVPQ